MKNIGLEVSETIKRFAETKRLAVIGASSSTRKFSGNVWRTLRARSLDVLLVNPQHSEIDGTPCYPAPAEIPGGVESAIFVLPADQAVDMVTQAESAGIRRIWFQQGGKYDEAARLASSLGIETVTGRCVLMYIPPVDSIHAVHRFIARLFRVA